MPGVVVLQSHKVLTIIRHPLTIPNDRSEVNDMRTRKAS
jgi:hypothetical protein